MLDQGQGGEVGRWGGGALHLEQFNHVDSSTIPMWTMVFQHAMISFLDDNEFVEADDGYIGEPIKTKHQDSICTLLRADSCANM